MLVGELRSSLTVRVSDRLQWKPIMLHQDRRDWLRSSLLGSAAVLLTGRSASGEAEEPQPIAAIDTHTHFYDPTRPEGIAWPSKNDKLLYRRVLPEDFLKVARPLGVVGTVVVEASPRLEDNQWLLDLAAKEKSVVGVVGRLTPGDDGFRDHLKRFAKNPLFRGIRVNAAELGKGLEQARYRDDLARLADSDLELDVNGGPDMPPIVARVAEQLPKLRIVINHLANVPIDGKEVKPDWLAGLQQAAKHSQVWCKVSALVDGTRKTDGKAPTEVDFYRPVLDAAWNTFGADRLIYGSNWPVSDNYASYASLLGIVSAYFSAKGKATAEKFFRNNAQAAYKFGR
jgi:predicted TIM-barrel fold metal-dependent hydrolase